MREQKTFTIMDSIDNYTVDVSFEINTDRDDRHRFGSWDNLNIIEIRPGCEDENRQWIEGKVIDEINEYVADRWASILKNYNY